MDSEVEIKQGIVPTVVAFDELKNDFIIGQSAKNGGVYGKTNAFNFKKDIGKPDSVYRNKNSFWMTPDGKAENAITLSTHEVAKIFLQRLLNKYEIPEQVYIGIPASQEKSWNENYKTHLKGVLAEIGYPDPIYYYEQFAVFQSFKNRFQHLDFAAKSLLIIDIGGSTFNTCVVRSTNLGKIRQGASAHGVPLGIISEQTGGVYVDERLVVHLVEKNKLMPKEPAENILKKKEKSEYLYSIENAKIDLSKKFSSEISEGKNGENLVSALTENSGFALAFPKSSLSLKINDLKTIVKNIAIDKWIPQLERTIHEARAALVKSNVNLKEIDYVVLAGGSSQLPGLEEELSKALTHVLSTKTHFYHMHEDGYSVAEGLAITAEEESSRNPSLISNKNARCLLGSLFLGVKQSRAEEYVFPKFLGSEHEDGCIISGPQEIAEKEICISFELPFLPKECLIFGFCGDKKEATENIILNMGSEIHRLSNNGKFTKSANLYITFNRNSYVSAKIELMAKKKSDNLILKIGDFDIDSAQIKSGNKFIGIDFGNSNSYVVEHISLADDENLFIYPNFSISSSIKTKLLNIEDKFIELKKNGVFSIEKSVEISRKNIINAVYHSNKMEGNKLSYGETINLLQGDAVATNSKDEIEVKNLANAYEWMIENYSEFLSRPIVYIKTVNQILMRGIRDDNGSFRSNGVQISGAEFTPPEHYSIPHFMDMLASEISDGYQGRSVLEFACAVHTKFVYIHPFGDGNGRTARIILDTILLHAQCPTLIIKSDEKPRYIDALLQCNRGDISAFIELYADTLSSALVKLESDFNQEKTKINSSSFASIYTDIDSEDDPLIAVLRRRASLNITNKLDMYNAFYAECELFRDSVIQVIHNVQANDSYGSDISITSSKLGDLSLESFREIIENKDTKPFWYFSLSVNDKKIGGRNYIFYFRFKEDSECGISIYLGKSGDTSGLLSTDPIRLRELRYKSSDSKLVAINFDQLVSDAEYPQIVKKLIAEIVQFYILS